MLHFGGEHYGTAVFLDNRLNSFRIPGERLINNMSHGLPQSSFTPFSAESCELKPFEHCVILKQALNAVGPKGRKLAVYQDRDTTVFRSSDDFHARNIVQRSAEKVLNSFKGDFSKLPLPSKAKEKPKVAVFASGHLAEYLDAPLLDISKMHKEDNTQAVVFTPRASLVLEEKEAREQLRRVVEFHEMFQQVANFLSTLQENSSTHDQGSLINTLKNFSLYFSLCRASFEKEVAYFSEKSSRKRMEVRLAAMDNFVNHTLRTPFMTSDPLSVNIVSPESARETVRAIKELPDRVLEKAFKDPNLPMKAVKRKPTRPTLINIPQKQGPGTSTGYQNKSFTPQQVQHPMGNFSQHKKGAQSVPTTPRFQQKAANQGQSSFQRKDKQGGGKTRDRVQHTKRQDKDSTYRRRHWGCSGRQASAFSGGMGRWCCFYTCHHQARLSLGVDLQTTSFVHPKACGRSPRIRRSLQALPKGGYLQSPSATLLPGKPFQRSQSLRGISPNHRSLSPEQIHQGSSFYHDQPW